MAIVPFYVKNRIIVLFLSIKYIERTYILGIRNSRVSKMIGMIDIHCHILPIVDDGPRSEAQFLDMAKMAVDDGITHIIATPHHMNGTFMNPKQKILDLVLQANQMLHSQDIPLTITPGQEVHVYDDLVEDVRNQNLLFLDHRQKYILLELPYSVPHYMEQLVYDLRLLGVTPIIPHPELYPKLREFPILLYHLVKSGALVQITAASLTGQYGHLIRKFCCQLIKYHLAHVIASDAHNTNKRIPNLSKAYKQLALIGGEEVAFDFKSNAEKVVNGEYITVEEPMRMEKEKIFGLF